MGRGPLLLTVGFVTPKWSSVRQLLAADPSGGGFSPKEVDKNFFGRRFFEPEGRFGRIRVRTVVSARF